MTYDNLTYCHISSGVIDAIYCGPFPEGDGFEMVPDSVSPNHGDLRGFWDAEWNLIPLATLVAENVVPCPGGYKLVSGELIEMTIAEKISSGAVVVPDGQIFDATLDGGLGGIRDMTPQESARAGKMALSVIQSILISMVSGWLPTLLDRGFPFKGVQFSASASLQGSAQGILTAILVGIPVTFPLPWPAADDTTTAIASEDDFKLFAQAMLGFVQITSVGAGNVKTTIRGATTAAQAADIFDAWEVALQ